MTSVYLDGYSFDLRRRNSDWSYVERKMPRVADWATDIRFVHQHSRSVMLRANYKAARAAIGRRIGLPISRRAADTDRLDAAELARSGCDLVFSHREFPLNAGDIPVVWMSAIVDPEMEQTYFGLSQAEMDENLSVKGDLFHRAAAVQVCSDAEAGRHARLFPDIADRFIPVPLFGPHLRAAEETILEKHRAPRNLKILFIGNQARRKGLPEALEAYISLPAAVRKSTTFTIVSSFDRGAVPIPASPDIEFHRGLPQNQVLALLARAHILINPAHHESYGMVFLEAMSQGTLCIGPDWEVQRELFDYGRAGVNVRCQVPLIRESMTRAIEDEPWRTALATSGWHRFNERYAPAVVAEQYAKLFRAVAAQRT